MKSKEPKLTMTFTPSEFKRFQNKIWFLSDENQTIDFEILDFFDERMNDGDLTKWIEWLMENKE